MADLSGQQFSDSIDMDKLSGQTRFIVSLKTCFSVHVRRGC